MKDLSATAHNKAAGDYLERARKSVERRRPEFAAQLSRELGLPIKPPTYASYEDARRPVPAALVWAAARLTGLPISDPQAEKALAERLSGLEEGLQQVRSVILELREARLLAVLGPSREGRQSR